MKTHHEDIQFKIPIGTEIFFKSCYEIILGKRGMSMAIIPHIHSLSQTTVLYKSREHLLGEWKYYTYNTELSCTRLTLWAVGVHCSKNGIHT